ncbi:hypothetical protein RWA06_04765 [Sinorhizobium meliloti]|uniref:hypothetical protein n=1 Tax=Rhizobium meliloti TaxID=382 RepID=UPI00299E44D2|nr:hypothetical protein [Sinorhizobium meliloti]
MTDIPEDVMKLAREAAAAFTWSSTTEEETAAIARAIMQDRASRIRSCLLDKPEAVEGEAVTDAMVNAAMKARYGEDVYDDWRDDDIAIMESDTKFILSAALRPRDGEKPE